MTHSARWEAVLFDLDGTLVDTAPDLGAAINKLLVEENKAPLAAERIRPQVSNGAAGLVNLAFGLKAGDDNFEQLRQRFLDHYAEDVCVHSQLFEGMRDVLQQLENAGLGWGIVTNKPAALTAPVVKTLALTNSGSTVSGDSIPQRKPHPAPLFKACEEMAVDPKNCIYVGDAERDIAAGNAAGMHTIIVNWGYLDGEKPTTEWNADEIIDYPREILSTALAPRTY